MNLGLKDILAIWGALTGTIGIFVGTYAWRLNRRLSSPPVLDLPARILDSLTDGIYVTDTKYGRIKYANKAFAEMFGYSTPDEVVNRPVTSLYTSPQDFRRAIDQAQLLRPVGHPIYIRTHRKTGQYLDIAVVSYKTVIDALQVQNSVITMRKATNEELAPTTDAPKVFISYSHLDSDFVTRLANDLNKRGLKVWLDASEINVGESIPSKIQSAIAGCDFLLAVLSESSLKSRWFHAEVDSGMVRELQSDGIFVLPILARKCTVPPLLTQKKYADFTRDYDHALEDLVTSIYKLHRKKRFRERDEDNV